LDHANTGMGLPPKAAPEALEFLQEIFVKNNFNEKSAPNKKLQSSLGDLMQLRPAASNAWAVGESLSSSGAPILHNDMHLTHSLPSLIFLQHLKMPGLNVSGATMPGLPFMISGYNGKVAWGVTSAVADVVDLVIEKPDPANPDSVLNQRRHCPIKTKKVVIKVKDKSDQEFEVRSTCNGPVLNDLYPNFLPENSPILAIRLKLPNVQESFGHLYQANQAQDVFELRDALMRIPGPIQNVMAGDHQGNIGFFATGSVPKRINHRGAFPIPGWLEKYEWKGWMSKDEMPKSFNPEKDYFINANNLIHNVYKNTPFFHVEAAPSHRFDRIKEKLLGLETKDQAGLQNIQKDTFLYRASKILPHALEDLNAAKGWDSFEQAALKRLSDWDYSSGSDSKGSAIFMSFYRKALHEALENKLDPSALYAFLKQRYSANVADLWFKRKDHPVWDNPHTPKVEERSSNLVLAFKKSVKELREKLGDDIENWRWGELHYHRPTHTFGKKNVLSFFNLPKVPMAGGLDSVWKAHFNLNDFGDPFKVAAGPVYRFSIDLANPEKAGYSTDTGASGWPLSPHYSDQHELWKKGELIPIERDMQKLKESHPDQIMDLIP
ncbi:MAG: penicillin acylase family protein, partial [Bacteriovoracaceae bacterium]